MQTESEVVAEIEIQVSKRILMIGNRSFICTYPIWLTKLKCFGIIQCQLIVRIHGQ